MISGLYVVALTIRLYHRTVGRRTGSALIGMVVIGASLVIAVFAAVLQRLLQEAIDIKSENDLTV